MKSKIKIIEKYKNMSLLVKASFWFTICNFLQKAITMISTPIFTRVLSENEYGMISLYFSWQNILFLITSLSLYKAMMNLYVKDTNKDKIISAVSGLSILLTFFWLLIYVFFNKQISNLLDMSNTLTLCMFLTFIVQSVIQCWMTYKRYIYDYKSVIIVTTLLTFFSTLISVLSVIFIRPTAEARILSQTVIYVIIGIFIIYSIFKKNKTFFDKQVWSFSFSFCIVLLPHYLSEFVLQSSDKLMINYMCGTREVAMYSIAYAAGSLINLITSAINSSFAPYQYQMIQGKKYDELAKTANNVLLFVGIMLVLIMLFSREIVMIFGGMKYLESATVIIPICIGVYFNYVFQLFARVQEYFEHKLTVVIPSILCAIINLILNYIFIKIYGYQAAAYTTFVSYMLFCFVLYIFYKKVCNKDLKGIQLYDIKEICKISFLLILMGGLIMVINKFILLKYLLIFFIFILMFIFKDALINSLKNIFIKN